MATSSYTLEAAHFLRRLRAFEILLNREVRMVRPVTLAIVFSLAALEAGAANLYVDRAGVIVRADPRGGGREVARLKLGDRVERIGRKRGWYAIKLADGRQGWVYGRGMSKRMPSTRSICIRGRRLVARGQIAAGVVYLKLAADRGTDRRRCLRALADVYRSGGRLGDARGIRERLRKLERWLPGRWCDSSQNLRLTIQDAGDYRLEGSDQLIGDGKYHLRADELRLRDRKSRARDVNFLVRERGFGHVLVARSSEELQKVFCKAQ